MTGEVAADVRGAGMRSAVASPIVVERRLWGAMVVLSPRDEPLPEDTEARLTDFTELVATAIANAESREALARLAEEQAALRRVATLVAGGTGPDQLFAAVADEAQELFGAEISAIIRFEDDATVVTVGARGGPNQQAHVRSSIQISSSLPFARRGAPLGSTPTIRRLQTCPQSCGRRAPARPSPARSSSRASCGAQSWSGLSVVRFHTEPSGAWPSSRS